jgi:hypothetical protein
MYSHPATSLQLKTELGYYKSKTTNLLHAILKRSFWNLLQQRFGGLGIELAISRWIALRT